MDERDLLQFSTLHELQRNASLAFGDNPLFGTYQKKEGQDASFEFMTYKEFGTAVDNCRTVLKDLGVKEFSKVGIISNNRWEWAAIAAASYSLNATLVPMYEAQLPSDWTYIANDAECSVLFCATQKIYDLAVAEVLPQTPTVKATLCLDAPNGEPFAFSTHMEAAAKANAIEPTSIIAPTPDDLANLIYTSGTTGKPKGVELIHSNTVSNVYGVRGMVDDELVHDFVRESDVTLAFLPWAHSYGQTCELWVGMAHGQSSGICRGVPFILEDLQMVKPTVLFAVPTLHKKIYDGVHNLMESSSPIRKKLMQKALTLGRKNVIEKNGGEAMGFLDRIQYRALDKIVLSKIRDRFGGRLRHGFVAGAACPSEVINFLDDIGIPICEGYGLTETSPIIAINTPYDRSPGFVGKPIPNVHVVIMGEDGLPVPLGQEGEICCYGPNVMRGYYKNPKATEEVISLAPDGKSRLFHTGDLGRLSDDGWLKVTGRLKEQYKLENGKYVCPTPIEEAISMSRFVMQVVLCGANREYNVALIVPDWTAIRSELQLDESLDEESLVNDERVRSLVKNDIAEKCKKLKKFEVPHDFAFVAPFTAANNMLTPKMSIRRHMVIREYEDVIQSMYSDNICAPSGDGCHEQKEVA
jgi:long-chain acyl-CoA synthetase